MPVFLWYQAFGTKLIGKQKLFQRLACNLQIDISKTKEILKENNKIKYKNISHNDKVAKISIVGAGMVSTPGVTYRMFRGLADSNINILAISTSEIKLSVIIDEEKTLDAVKKLHTIFDLDWDGNQTPQSD